MFVYFLVACVYLWVVLGIAFGAVWVVGGCLGIGLGGFAVVWEGFLKCGLDDVGVMFR